MEVKIELMYDDVELPEYANKWDSGMDIKSYETLVIKPGETKLVKTGIKLGIPKGYEIQVRPRSGLSLKTNLVIPNSPGTVDSNYCDELGIIFRNESDFMIYQINKGDRIAQLVLSKVPRIEWNVVKEIDKSNDRGGGFGSSGK